MNIKNIPLLLVFFASAMNATLDYKRCEQAKAKYHKCFDKYGPSHCWPEYEQWDKAMEELLAPLAEKFNDPVNKEEDRAAAWFMFNMRRNKWQPARTTTTADGMKEALPFTMKYDLLKYHPENKELYDKVAEYFVQEIDKMPK